MKKVIGIAILMVIGAGLISLAKADIKYNVFNNEWSFEREASTLEYNPFDNFWEFSK